MTYCNSSTEYLLATYAQRTKIQGEPIQIENTHFVSVYQLAYKTNFYQYQRAKSLTMQILHTMLNCMCDSLLGNLFSYKSHGYMLFSDILGQT